MCVRGDAASSFGIRPCCCWRWKPFDRAAAPVCCWPRRIPTECTTPKSHRCPQVRPGGGGWAAIVPHVANRRRPDGGGADTELHEWLQAALSVSAAPTLAPPLSPVSPSPLSPSLIETPAAEPLPWPRRRAGPPSPRDDPVGLRWVATLPREAVSSPPAPSIALGSPMVYRVEFAAPVSAAAPPPLPGSSPSQNTPAPTLWLDEHFRLQFRTAAAPASLVQRVAALLCGHAYWALHASPLVEVRSPPHAAVQQQVLAADRVQQALQATGRDGMP